MPDSSIEKASAILYEAHKNSKTCAPIRNFIAADDISTAYKIQEINIQKRMIEERTEIVGRKIGLTAESVQQQLGVDQPDFGTLLQNMRIENKGTLPMEQLVQPKAEAEIAFVLSEDILQALSTDELMSKIDHARASIEVVGSRIENWNIKIADTIADNASASHFVLGENKGTLSQEKLKYCRMKMYRNGELVSEGSGEACLGSPLNAFKWLADKMIEMQTPLLKGDVVMTGALGKMVDARGGDHFKAEIDGLGSVEITFGNQ